MYREEQWREMAEGRIAAYDMIVGVLSTLPDQAFLDKFRGKTQNQFLHRYKSLGQEQIQKGGELIDQYMSRTEGTAKELETLAVDRTNLLRAPQKGRLQSPYESQYLGKKKGKENLLIELGRAYHKGGFFPKKGIDAADFLLIELDFMRVLTKEMAKPSSKVKEILEMQHSFMANHLGNWAPGYIEKAVAEAETDFYRGWLYFLEGFLAVEKELLEAGVGDR